MKHFWVILTTVLSLALCVNAARASLINVDFGTDNSGGYGDTSSAVYSGAAVVGSSTDKWNGTAAYQNTTPISLIDSNGASSGVTMSYSGGYMWCCGTGCSFGDAANQYRNLMNDYLIAPSITLTGLAAGTYDLYIYCASDKTDRKATYTATTSVGSGSINIGPNSSYIGTLVAGVTYGLIRVTVGDNSTLTISASKISGSEIDICGFQLQSVPEPASLALLIAGAVGLLAYAWRKQSN